MRVGLPGGDLRRPSLHSRASGFPWLPQLTSPPFPPSPAPPGDGYVQADAQGPRDYEDHLYVNTQGLDALELLQPEDSPKKDLFDMRMWGQVSLRGRPPVVLIGEVQPPPLGTRFLGTPQVDVGGMGSLFSMELPGLIGEAQCPPPWESSVWG